MGTRSTRTSVPARGPTPRNDYRTLTLPAVSRPVRDAAPSRDDWEHADAYADATDRAEGADLSARAVPAPRRTRTLRAATARPRRVTEEPEGELPARSLVAPRATRGRSVALQATGGVLVKGAEPESLAVLAERMAARAHKKRVPIRLLASVVALVIVAAVLVAPRLTAADAAAACQWYTVQPGDTLANIGAAHRSTTTILLRANHLSDPSKLFVGEKLCIPTTWWAQTRSAPVIPDGAEVALPPGIMAGEPCTADRSIVWTVPVSRWAVPPGCFGLVYSPNPNNYMVNGHVIPGFGWCNWWPEALLRNPYALDWPEHSRPRVGFPVFYMPQIGQHVGHYAFVESIGPTDNPNTNGWILISEMNMYWRGAGWAKVNYRYIRVDYPGANYLYPN
jgi:LysM repeat protein